MRTVQIAVRLPEDLVGLIDRLVADGRFESRAAIVTRELRRLEQRLHAEEDAEIYRRDGEDPELAVLATWTADHPVALDEVPDAAT
jgi:Arc/MetJ-type ribon-helix-helix transcriptional regulator